MERMKKVINTVALLVIIALASIVYVQNAKIAGQQTIIKDYQHTEIVKTQQINNLTKIIDTYKK